MSEKLFPVHRCTVMNIIPAVSDDKNEDYQQLKLELLKFIFKTDSHVARFTDDHGIITTTKFRRHCNIFLIDNLNSFTAIYPKIDGQHFRPHGLFIMIMLDKNQINLDQFFAMLWKKGIFHVFAVYKDQNSVNIASFYPFRSNEKCNNAETVIINKFVDKKFIKPLQFPDKFSNLNNCPIRVTTFNQGTAVMKEVSKDGKIKIHGHEIKLIETLAEKLNFTLVMKFRDGNQQWGNIYENGTSTKALGELMIGQADIVFGDFFLKPVRIKYLDSSDSYLNYPVVFMIPRGEKFTVMEKLMQPFEPIVWILLLITVIVGLLVIFIINHKYRQFKSFIYGTKVRQPVMNMIIVILGSQQPKLPKRNFARFILMMFIILCLVLRSIYQGSLYQFLQSDGRHKEAQTIQEMIDRNFTIITHDSYYDVVSENPELFKIMKEVEVDERGNPVPNEEKTSVFFSRTMLIHYSQSHKDFPYKICREQLMTVNIVLYYPKYFYLRTRIDTKLNRMVSGGLVEHWLSKYDNTRYWTFHTKLGPRSLSLDHLIGSFYILIFGQLCGTAAFIFEIFIDKCLKIKKFPVMIH